MGSHVFQGAEMKISFTKEFKGGLWKIDRQLTANERGHYHSAGSYGGSGKRFFFLLFHFFFFKPQRGVMSKPDWPICCCRVNVSRNGHELKESFCLTLMPR